MTLTIHRVAVALSLASLLPASLLGADCDSRVADLPYVGTGQFLCEEFAGADHLAWRWGNQGTSTLTVGDDSALLTAQTGSGDNWRVRWTSGAASGSDFIISSRQSYLGTANFNGTGLAVLSTGTESSPTLIHLCWYQNTNQDFAFHSYTSYTGGATQIGLTVGITEPLHGLPYWVELRYTASTKGLSCLYSLNGEDFVTVGSTTLGAHPTDSFGFAANSASSSVPAILRVFYIRQLIP